MVSPISNAYLTAQGIDSLERLVIGLGLHFSKLTGALSDTDNNYEAVTFSLRSTPIIGETGETDGETKEIEFDCYFNLDTTTQTDGGELLTNVKEYDSNGTLEIPITPPSLITTPTVPTIPKEFTSSEQIFLWALLTLSASLYPAHRDRFQIDPEYGDGVARVQFQLPLDSQAIGLNAYQLIQSVDRIVGEYVELGSGAVSSSGPDVYEVAVSAGFAGTKEEWLESLN